MPKQLCRRRLIHPADHLGPIVARWMRENPRPVLDSARFRIVGAEHQTVDAEQGNCCRTERTGFKGYKQPAALQKFPTPPLRRRAQRENFGMRGRIGASLNLVAGRGKHGPASIDDNGANRHLATARGGFGFRKGLLHRGHACSLALTAG